MAKIMQVINKKSNFQNGTVDLQLYQTGFISLTKLIDTLPGQTVENALVGQKLGFEFFHDLNNKQLATRDYIDRYKPVYNLEIDKKLKIVPSLVKFDYSWKSCVDYKSQIKAGDRADYRLLTKIVAAEKELYDYRFYAGDHIKRNCKLMGYWARDKNYFSTLIKIEMGWDAKGDWHPSSITFRTGAFTKQLPYIKTQIGNEGTVITKEDLEKIKEGDVGIVTVDRFYTIEFSVVYLDNDKGYRYRVTHNANSGRPVIYNNFRTGQSPAHFSKAQGVYDLDFFKTRVLM